MSKRNKSGVIPEWLRDYKKDNTQLPVVVYGTLRSGQGNYRSRIHPFPHTMTPVTVKGHAMYPMSGFPFVTPMDGAMIVGEIVEFPEEVWEHALRGLDSLEGYRGEGASSNLYNRVRVMATLENGTEVEAYMYVVGNLSSLKSLTYYQPGDWIKWRKDTQEERHRNLQITYSERARRERDYQNTAKANGATFANGVGASFLS